MSELLYMFGEMDERVRPLTFCVRRWAHCCGLTNPSPGRWITNFSLTCLVIFFLQQSKQPILPAINTLIRKATPNDIRLTEDGINCTFARNLQSIGFRSANKQSLSELLLQFFEFYAQFDFHNKAISLNEGRVIAKPEYSPMYIVNPLELALNVCKNVSLEECERFRIEVRNAAWILESELESTSTEEYSNTTTSSVVDSKDNNTVPSEGPPPTWGLLSIFKPPERSNLKANIIFKPRILEVSELFNRNEDGEEDVDELNDMYNVKGQHLKIRKSQPRETVKGTFKEIGLSPRKVVNANEMTIEKTPSSRRSR